MSNPFFFIAFWLSSEVPVNPLQYIFRMVHVDNIPHILEAGLTHRNSENANQDFRPIGDSTLISTRDTKLVRISDTNEQIILGNYIPFYFGARTPMLYVMQHGGNYVPGKTSPKDIIYCVVKLSTLIDQNFTFYFSDGHATDGFTQFFSDAKFDELNDLVDVRATRATWWNDEGDRDLKRRKQAELLISGDVPYSCIAGFITYNEETKSQLVMMGISKEIVHVSTEYYF